MNNHVSFYQNFLSRYGWKHLEPFIPFLDQIDELLTNRSLYSFTSHELLVCTAYPTYPDWFDHDQVAIHPMKGAIVNLTYRNRGNGEAKVDEIVCYNELLTKLIPLLDKLKQSKPN